jgi:hypothetical protein
MSRLLYGKRSARAGVLLVVIGLWLGASRAVHARLGETAVKCTNLYGRPVEASRGGEVNGLPTRPHLVFRVDGKSLTCLFTTPEANATCDTVIYGAEWFSGLEPSRLGDTFDEILDRNLQGSRWLRPEVFSIMPSHVVWQRQDGGAVAEYISRKYLIVRSNRQPISGEPDSKSTVPAPKP